MYEPVVKRNGRLLLTLCSGTRTTDRTSTVAYQAVRRGTWRWHQPKHLEKNQPYINTNARTAHVASTVWPSARWHLPGDISSTAANSAQTARARPKRAPAFTAIASCIACASARSSGARTIRVGRLLRVSADVGRWYTGQGRTRRVENARTNERRRGARTVSTSTTSEDNEQCGCFVGACDESRRMERRRSGERRRCAMDETHGTEHTLARGGGEGIVRWQTKRPPATDSARGGAGAGRWSGGGRRRDSYCVGVGNKQLLQLAVAFGWT